jgi:DNA-directed RNA polymerase subunit RPC12/RpoP
MKEKISRNEPCPCGSGKKYKKCCLGTDKDPGLIRKCVLCGKDFNRMLEGTFQTQQVQGNRLYFCPKCNSKLKCSHCRKEIGEKPFNLFSCEDCGAVTVICENCEDKDWDYTHH